MGQTASPAILVTGVAQHSTPITVTATAAGVTRTGTIRVLGDGVTIDIPTLHVAHAADGQDRTSAARRR